MLAAPARLSEEPMNRKETCDIIVIGGGSAAHEAAIAARQAGAERVIMLEKAPFEEFGGNARYSDRKSTRLNSSHVSESRMPSSA